MSSLVKLAGQTASGIGVKPLLKTPGGGQAVSGFPIGSFDAAGAFTRKDGEPFLFGFTETPISGAMNFPVAHMDSNHADFVVGTGDYQIDFWMKCNSFPGGGFSHSVIDFRTGGGQNQIGLGLGPGGTLAGQQLVIGQWYHITQARKAGVLKHFIDGVEQNSNANTTNFTSSRFRFGGPYNSPNPQWQFNGIASNIRFIKGTPIYFDSDFAVAPFEASIEPGTVLLAARGNGLLTDDSGTGKTITQYNLGENFSDYPGA